MRGVVLGALVVIPVFGASLNVIAKDIVSVNATKFEQMPVGVVNSHSPDTVSYNKELIEMKPQAQNIFAVLNGNHSVEYQQNLQDMGGHTGVSINQLPFYYTSTFIDGIFVPDNFLDTSQLFSTDSTQSVKVNRGASSAGYAPASLAGSVNIETLNVEKTASSGKILGGGYSHLNASFVNKYKIDETSGMLISLSVNKQSAIDNNKDNIAESPKINNFQTTLAHQFNDGSLKVKTRFDVSQNTRHGGSMIRNKHNHSGNPFNFQNGGSSVVDGWIDDDGDATVYNGGSAGMMEVIDTQRVSALSSVESDNYISGGVVSLLKRDNFYMGNEYEANEANVFLTSARKINIGNSKFKIGGDFHHQRLDSKLHYADGHDHDDDRDNESHDEHSNNPDGYTYNTVSVFANANSSFGKFDTDISVRAVHHNKFNSIGVLRGKMNYHHTDAITSTLSAGNGYFVPSSSFEQNHSMFEEEIQTLQRKITKATQVFNASYNTAFSYNNLQMNLNYNYNEIKNIATLEVEDGSAVFRNLHGEYKVQGIGFDASYFISPTLLLGFSAERYWHDLSNLESGFVILSRPEYKIATSITKKSERHLFRLKGSYIGRQDLEEFYGKVYNLAGIQNARYSKEYLLLDADYSFKINKEFKIFAGVENMLDFLQVDSSNTIATRVRSGSHDGHGHDEDADHSHNHAHIDNINSWGPVRGRFFYIGINVEL